MNVEVPLVIQLESQKSTVKGIRSLNVSEANAEFRALSALLLGRILTLLVLTHAVWNLNKNAFSSLYSVQGIDRPLP